MVAPVGRATAPSPAAPGRARSRAAHKAKTRRPVHAAPVARRTAAPRKPAPLVRSLTVTPVATPARDPVEVAARDSSRGLLAIVGAVLLALAAAGAAVLRHTAPRVLP